MLKFLIDENCGIRIVKALDDEGWDVAGVIGAMNGAKDRDVLEMACREDRILVTSDKDFGDMVYHQALPHKGIILLRLEDDTMDSKLATIKKVVLRFQGKLKGRFVVATEKKIRLR